MQYILIQERYNLHNKHFDEFEKEKVASRRGLNERIGGRRGMSNGFSTKYLRILHLQDIIDMILY